MSFTPDIAASPQAPFHGKVVVVTGASDGIGRAAVRQYAAGGATVVMVGRNEAKTRAAAQSIMSETGRRDISWQIADLSRQDEVHGLASRLLTAYPEIHVLANNAGAMFLEREETADGFERTFALNHLSYFALAVLLLPALAAASAPGAPARILNVSSRAHENARPDLEDLQLTRGFGGWRAYANSKLFNIWFTRSLARRLPPATVMTQSLHPGVVSTRFATNNGRMGRVLRGVMDLVSVTPDAGADTLVWLSHAPEALHPSGAYWVKRALKQPSRVARNDTMAEALWQHTIALTGIDADRLILRALEHHAAH